MSVLIHAMRMTIHTDPGAVTIDLSDEPNIMAARMVCTPGQAEKIAAQLLMEAEKARSSNLGEIA